MKKGCILLCSFILVIIVSAQNKSAILGGPMLGYVELRTARIWCEVSPQTNKVSVSYKKAGIPSAPSVVTYKGKLGEDFNPVILELNGLDFNTTYSYELTAVAGSESHKKSGLFTTTDLWQYRKNFPDLTFLTGSCAYLNEAKVDRQNVEFINPKTPAKPYGGDSSIFETMAKEKAAFNLWLGDNWYYREVDYWSAWGLSYRASVTRKTPVLQNLLKAMPQYGIWDDHDYGPNDADKSYLLKDKALEIFKNYWPNPSYGQNGQGIYTKLSYSDVDFFLMDDRWFRSSDRMSAQVDGKPNPDKRMWGKDQMEWLKNALKNSNTNFKIIVTGSQTLNRASPFDCLQTFPIEFNELMDFLKQEKINGVLFLTGDRHHSEVIKYERAGTYSLYDITVSPFTASVAKPATQEENNPDRIPGTLVVEQNYGRITVSGPPRSRVLKVEYIGLKGQKYAEWSIGEGDLRN